MIYEDYEPKFVPHDLKIGDLLCETYDLRRFRFGVLIELNKNTFKVAWFDGFSESFSRKRKQLVKRIA